MLFERASEVSSFNRYMLPGIANKTDQRSMIFRYPQQFVAGAVGQKSPFIHGNNGVLKLRAFLRSEQKRFDCLAPVLVGSRAAELPPLSSSAPRGCDFFPQQPLQRETL